MDCSPTRLQMVPISPALTPSWISAWCVSQAVVVLPLVPVTPSSLSFLAG